MKLPTEDLYSLLQVRSTASTEVIHAAYRVLAKGAAPDEDQLRELNCAKDVLLDPVERARYDATRIPVGTMIGSYRLTSKIAQGSFGTTFKAEHKELTSRGPACVKHAGKVGPVYERIIFEETEAIWDLRHNGIPAVRDLVKLDDGSWALVTSYIEGQTLTEILLRFAAAEKRMDPEHVAWITERCLNTLKYLHYHGVVHGDLKPGNIIIQAETHEVVIVDYGLSMIMPDRNSKAKGHTEGFAPPEQLDGNTLLPESDLYSLGMTMICALGGDVEKKRVPASTPVEMKRFIQQLTQKNVLERPRWPKHLGGEDLVDTFRAVREKAFGSRASGMKPLVLP